MTYNPIEFIQGQRDCKNGVIHKAGKGDSYDAGYNYEYHREQMMTHSTMEPK